MKFEPTHFSLSLILNDNLSNFENIKHRIRSVNRFSFLNYNYRKKYTLKINKIRIFLFLIAWTFSLLTICKTNTVKKCPHRDSNLGHWHSVPKLFQCQWPGLNSSHSQTFILLVLRLVSNEIIHTIKNLNISSVFEYYRKKKYMVFIYCRHFIRITEC